MLQMLSTFAALSMCGTVMLSLLPEGGIKRTAGLAVGLLTLMCWAEGIAGLLGIPLTLDAPSTAFAPTALSIQDAMADASAQLEAQWEDMP